MKIVLRKWIRRFLVTILVTTLLLISIVLAINLYISYAVSPFIFTDATSVQNNRVALVLGTSKKISKNRLNSYFQYRMEAAAELYHKGIVQKILVSGDNGTIYYNEPIDMKKSLIELGVEEKDITLDYAGFRTFDSMVRAKKIFGLDEFIVVSQKAHSQRGVYIARHHGIDAIAFVAKDPRISVKQQVREYLAKVKAFLDIHVLDKQPGVLGPKETLK